MKGISAGIAVFLGCDEDYAPTGFQRKSEKIKPPPGMKPWIPGQIGRTLVFTSLWGILGYVSV